MFPGFKVVAAGRVHHDQFRGKPVDGGAGVGGGGGQPPLMNRTVEQGPGEQAPVSWRDPELTHRPPGIPGPCAADGVEILADAVRCRECGRRAAEREGWRAGVRKAAWATAPQKPAIAGTLAVRLQ